jgi:hypothetical protein
MPTRRVVRRATKDYNYEDVGDDAVMNNRKRAASEAAAHVTYDEISELFGLSLAEAANRIGVRATLPSWGLREVRARGPPVLRGWHMRHDAECGPTLSLKSPDTPTSPSSLVPPPSDAPAPAVIVGGTHTVQEGVPT